MQRFDKEMRVRAWDSEEGYKLVEFESGNDETNSRKEMSIGDKEELRIEKGGGRQRTSEGVIHSSRTDHEGLMRQKAGKGLVNRWAHIFKMRASMRALSCVMMITTVHEASRMAKSKVFNMDSKLDHFYAS